MNRQAALKLMASPEPIVRLEKAFREPFRNFIATAKTCYSSRGIVRDEAIGQGFESLAGSIYRAGHHTTLQHAHFQFSLANVSRQFVWSFLHSHPFYNSEQVSQRYVRVQLDHFAIPPMPAGAREVYLTCVRRQMEDYRRLVELLRPAVEREYAKRFPPGPAEGDRRRRRAIERKAQEIARYVLPVATFAYLYHTVNGLTLLRYHRLCQQSDAPAEQRLVVGKMVHALLDYDPLYRTILEEPLAPERTPEAAFPAQGGIQAGPFAQEFDTSLEGRTSKLVAFQGAGESLLADAVREVLGLPSSALSDSAAIELALSPAKNRLLGETMNLTAHAKLARPLVHVGYTFRRKLSHTADSQDQRHRMTPASRPILARHLTEEPDYITPGLIALEPEAERLYRESMERTWEAIAQLKRLGAERQSALYLLPNAVSIRFTESADLLNLRHKLAMRLCYNAQEEIWRASLDEVRQVAEIHPRIGRYLLPPCGIRQLAGVSPPCPEGERFCGERVWTYDFKDYRRII